mgnify:CR=1 FL=1
MATKIIGLDLGQREVRAWLMDVGFSSREFTGAFYREILPIDGESQTEAQLRTAYELLEAKQLTHESYALALPRQLTSVLIHRLPIAQMKLVDEILPGELEDLLPFEIDEIFYDYQIIGTDDDELELLIAYAVREEFEQFMGQCFAAQIDPKVLTLGGLYTEAIVPKSQYNDLAHQVILDIGASGAEWTFYLGGSVKYLQRCDVGGLQITKKLAEVFKVDDEMAEVGKLSEAKWLAKDTLALMEDGNQKQLAERINEAIEEALLPLKAELIRSLAFAEMTQETPIEKVYLTGGSSKLNGIETYLEQSLNMPVQRLDYPAEISTNLSTGRDGSQDYLAYVMADGLAQRLYTKSINFRKDEYTYARDAGILRSLSVAVSIALFCIIALQGTRLYYEQMTAIDEITLLESEVEQLGVSLLGKEGLELDTIKFKVNSAKEQKVLVPDISAFDTLGELSRFISKDVSVELDRLTIALKDNGRGSLELRGKTTTVGEVSAVIEAVEKTSCFSERVKKDKVSKSVDERTVFRVTASSKCK